MRVLIYEPDHGGHRYTYIRHLLTGLTPLKGIDAITLLISRPGHASDEYRAQIAPFERKITVIPELEVPQGSQLDVAREKYHGLKDALDKYPSDHLYVPSGDGISQILGARCMLPGKGIFPKDLTSESAFHLGSFAFPAAGLKRRVKAALSFKALERAPWTRLHFVNPLVYEAAKVLSPTLAAKAVVLADSVDPVKEIPKDIARRSLGLETGGRWIGSAGAIDERKGCDLLLAAFDASRTKNDDRLLLAGKATDSIRNIVKSKYQNHVDAGRLVMLDRYLTDEELAWSLSGMDVVCTAHPSHVGLSNIALRALAANRFILGSSFGWLGRVVPAFGMGVVCDVSRTSEFAGAIEQSLEAAQWYKRPPAGDRLLQFHSQSNHIAGWTALIREKLGLPRQDVKTWEWVTGS